MTADAATPTAPARSSEWVARLRGAGILIPFTILFVVLSLTSDWDGGIYVRTTCDDSATELACIDQLGDNATEVMQLAVTAGTTYYVWVDGYTTESFGAYQLASELQ